MPYVLRARWADNPRGHLVLANKPIIYQSKQAAEADAQIMRNIFREELAEIDALQVEAGGHNEDHSREILH